MRAALSFNPPLRNPPAMKKPPGALSLTPGGNHRRTIHFTPWPRFPAAAIEGNCYAVSSDAGTLAPRCSKKIVNREP